jgi:hypothetical protein
MSLKEAFWRTLLTDRLAGQSPAPPHGEAMLAMLPEVATLTASDFPLRSQTLWQRRPVALQGLTDAEANAAFNSVIRASSGVWMTYIFVVLGVEVGDVFCLLDGCVVPFVLRPTAAAGRGADGKEDRFWLWGDGYVQGVMPGQRPGQRPGTGPDGGPKRWFHLV